MIERIRKYPSVAVGILAFYYAVGVAGLILDITRPVFTRLVPFTLLGSLFLLWLFDESLNKRSYLTALAIFILGFAIEVAGVNSGMIFGEYQYGKTLGLKLLDTPLMIGVNWLILIYSGWALTGVFFTRRWIRIFAGAVLMVIYDTALEPVAIRLDMWDWLGGPVPLQNYLAWFLVSLAFFIIFSQYAREVRNKLAPGLFIIQFMFFVVLNLLFSIN